MQLWHQFQRHPAVDVGGNSPCQTSHRTDFEGLISAAQVTEQVQRLIAETAKAFEEYQAKRGQAAASATAVARDEAALAASPPPMPAEPQGPSEARHPSLCEAVPPMASPAGF